MRGPVEKYDIVNGLAREFGLRRYLEICTSTTGKKYQFVARAQFEVCHRLMYRCPDGHQDGHDIAFRTAEDSSEALVRQLRASLPAAERYDIIFVDPHHTYRASALDLYGAMTLLAPHGVLVVHDCNPTDGSIVQPQFQDGDWCGVTYQAFVDFVLGGRAAGYCTVDADYGCGVVFNTAAAVPPAWRGARPPDGLAFEWAATRDDDAARFACFAQHRTALLNLVTPAHFHAVHPLTQLHSRIPRPDPTAPLSFTEDADLHLLADGARIAPFAAGDGQWRFRLPAGTRALRLVSRVVSPAMLGGGDDQRMLGFCLHGITVQPAAEAAPRDIDIAALAEGVHGAEGTPPHVWRWTAGDAPLPMEPLAGAEAVLTLSGHGMPRYPDTGPAA